VPAPRSLRIHNGLTLHLPPENSALTCGLVIFERA
jgi:hypothetical protein